MGVIKSITVLLILICSVIQGRTQNKKDCKNLVLSQIKKMSGHKKPKKGRFFQFSILSNTVYWSTSNTADTKLEMDILIGEDKSYYNTNYFSIYSDQINQFVILHPQQLIQWDQALTDELKKEKDFLKLIAHEDSLVRSSQLCYCEVTKTKDGKYKRGVFKPSKDIQEKSGVEEMEVWVDLKNREIYKVINWFSSKSKVKKQEVIYQHMDYNFKGKVPESAHDIVFSQPGILSLRYKDYEVIDQRKEGFYDDEADF